MWVDFNPDWLYILVWLRKVETTNHSCCVPLTHHFLNLDHQEEDPWFTVGDGLLHSSEGHLRNINLTQRHPFGLKLGRFPPIYFIQVTLGEQLEMAERRSPNLNLRCKITCWIVWASGSPAQWHHWLLVSSLLIAQYVWVNQKFTSVTRLVWWIEARMKLLICGMFSYFEIADPNLNVHNAFRQPVP